MTGTLQSGTTDTDPGPAFSLDPAAPPPAPAGGRDARRRRHRRVRRTLLLLGVVLVLVIGGVAGYGWYLNHRIQRIDLNNLTASPTRGPDAGTENVLMIGSTSRCALKVQSQAFGLCSEGVNGVNSDVVMILHLNPATRSLSVLSIPRDLFVPNARSDGANKIDAGLYDGPNQLIASIEEDFGIPIQHFVELNFDTFMNVVDALGGIRMYFPEPVHDAYSGLNVTTTGCLTLNGTQALQVVRARHLQYKGPGVTSTDPAYWPYDPQSDLSRIRRDHEFLRVLATAVKARGLGNPLTDRQLVSSVAGQLTVDTGFSLTEMLNMVLDFHSVDVNRAPQLTLPVAIDQFGSYYYQGGYYGDIEFPAEPQDRQTVRQFLGLPSGQDSFSGGGLPAAGKVTVSVLNGTGVSNQAADTAHALAALGFNIGTVGDSTPVGAEAETVVYYGSRRPRTVAAAQAVADSLSGAVIMAYDPKATSTGSQVTVVTGTDFSVNSPLAPTPARGSTASSAPTTTTTTTEVSGAFAAPSTIVQRLAPWDPRSCTAAGGAGP